MLRGTFHVDTREFSAALREYKKVSRSTLADILNRKACFVLRKAIELTPKAIRSVIENIFNVIGSRLSRSKATGKFKKAGNLYGKSHLAIDIVQAKRFRKGQPPLTQKEASAEGRKLIANRLRGIGSLRAGWSRSYRTFLSATKEAGAALGLPRVKRPGQAKIARPTTDPEAIFEYDLVTATHHAGGSSGPKEIDPRVASALQEAINIETAGMKEEIARRLGEAARPFNAR